MINSRNPLRMEQSKTPGTDGQDKHPLATRAAVGVSRREFLQRTSLATVALAGIGPLPVW